MVNKPWVMYESHCDFSSVWFAYCKWRERARELGFDPDRALGIGCIGYLKRFGVLVRIDLSQADLCDILRFDLFRPEDWELDIQDSFW